ncbi:sensor histidine kinase [Phyllobacterium salinisoli]|uniref:histidine kinase n=1 Tax=Phyllobacterium salinisoli TaxID=1899321 RepID=A0A368JW82_9HYPH|nr:sensor histidine kinase [Phyllobacterium salinisoli]RCS21407.1 sensor histidine kinase [Phyllobacterium salinisoli]
MQIAANRVAAVARVHQNFYLEAADEISCIGFLRRLCADLSGILDKPIKVDGDEGNVPTKRIQPIGLIVNELAANAAKHGATEINIVYEINGDVHELSVRDDGEGLPPWVRFGAELKWSRNESSQGSCGPAWWSRLFGF